MTCCRSSNVFVSINFHKKRSNMSCSLLKDENFSSLSCATIFKSVKNCHFPRVSCSVRKFLQDSHFISILSKRSSQASVDSVMYMKQNIYLWQTLPISPGTFCNTFSYETTYDFHFISLIPRNRALRKT